MGDLSTLCSVALADLRWAAAVAEKRSCRLHFTVLAASLKQTGFCIVQKSVANHCIFPPVRSTQLLKVREDGTRYLSWLNDMMRSFKNFSLLSDKPEKSEWAFTKNKSQSRDFKDTSAFLKSSAGI